jgi:Outer membrane protein
MKTKVKLQSIIFLLLICVSSYAQESNTTKPYTLEKCKELALKNNVKSQNSTLSLEAAMQTKKEAFTKYFPSISTMGVGFKATDPMMSMELPLGEMIGNPEMPPISMSMLKKGMIGVATVSQPVFAGGQIITGNKLAKIGVEASELQKTMSDDEVLLTVEQYFWQIVTIEEKVKTLTEAETLLNRAHEDVSNAYNAGMINKNELLKVELKQHELESNKLKINNGLKLSKMVLAQYVGVPYEYLELDAAVDETEINILQVRVDHQTALQQRTEYQLLNKSIEAGKMQVRMEVGKNLPTVAVGAGWNYMHFDKKSPMAMETDFGMGFVTVSVPITNWWGGSHAIKRQKINVQIAENDKRNAEEMLLIQMQQLWNELEEASLQIQLSEKAITSALENVRLNTDYYKAGTGLLTDLLDAQTALQQTRDQHTEATANYRIKISKYKQATGQR